MKTQDPNQDPLEKLSMLDEFGHRRFIIPAEVQGFYRHRRVILQWILLAVFLVIPWTKINGVQTILLNIPDRVFSLFGTTFWAHDGTLLFFIFISVACCFALVTALWGRVWCGWACPQTVFIDGFFRAIERLIEGNHLQRRALRAADLSMSKVGKITLKWLLFALCSSVIAHSFLAYFVGSDKLLSMIQSNPKDNWTPFVLVFSVTGILTFNFGWFREQFCIIMCPYGRFQSVLMDRSTFNVMYDETRGEPRRNLKDPKNQSGDCVSCSKCVQVCPTGIDIRNGLQMECIACTACIDACDDIMKKVGKPSRLIRYANISGRPLRLFRPRILIYASVMIVAMIALSINLIHRKALFVKVLRGTDGVFQLASDELSHPITINHFRAHIHNQSGQEMPVTVSLENSGPNQPLQLRIPNPTVTVPPGQSQMLHFFVTAPLAVLDQNGRVFAKITFNQTEQEITIVGPTPAN